MEEVLVYVNEICSNIDNTYEYDFMFSESKDDVWGEDWAVYNPSSCNGTMPDETTISKVYRVKTTMPLKTIQNTSCYSIEHAIFGILAVAWIDIENLQEYPANGRMVFHFGDSKDKVSELLSLYDFKLTDE